VSRSTLAVVVVVQCAALIAVCAIIGDNAWDDGAITLAFARTFARSGHIALTPHSEIVEGFSTISWFLVNAAVALARPSFHGAIFASQILAALSIAGSTALLARTCALLDLDRLLSTLTVVAFAAWGCSFAEAANGMEMGLLAAVMLVIVNELLRPRPRLSWLCAGVVVAAMTRLEAVLYVGLAGLAVVGVPRRRAFWAMLASGAGALALLTGWRLAVFADVLPNTFWAKRWPPYASLGLDGRLIGLVELPIFFIGPLLALMIAWRWGLDFGRALRGRGRTVAILAAPIGGALLMGALTGEHWGTYGRMPYFAVPLALVLFALVFSAWLNAGRPRRRVAVVIGAFVASIATSMGGFPTGSLAAARDGGAFGVTPHTYAETGRIMRRLAAAAELPHATVMTADVGGLALCCDELRIVDLGLLSNRTLAHRGPQGLAEVLAAEQPDLIEAHWKWTVDGTLYQLPYFRHYAPAFIGGTKLWIRRDVAEAIERRGHGCWLPADRADLRAALEAHRYANHDLPVDRTSFTASGVIFVPDQEPSGPGCLPSFQGK